MDKLKFFLMKNAAGDRKCPEGKGLSKLLHFFKIVFSSTVQNVNRSFAARISSDLGSETLSAKVVEFLCLSPSFGWILLIILWWNVIWINMHFYFRRMSLLFEQEIRCLILASGTLEPIQPLITEMGIERPLILSNEHIIKPSQTFVKVVSRGVGGVRLNSNFGNR